ncbi:PLP-dependent aminotransferase family protein [Psychromarinibacter sp. C21-152]|uniref:PLP-dependent aminotransferase family protein n=1 Tax=Psychromarinibacter sediminicola TaxID=3033385 RepID=A0AAE3TAL9_9RHOB|nr:PLP-dependent aminotransferase family protein [Psychromarinibacter sediminicola]MDF0602993.1 PLP-dependent aminotransferase family protein [Psychromarinibacter sediminicola]
MFDVSPLLPEGTPAPSARWSGFPDYNFVGGHIDRATVPVDDLRAAVDRALARDGHDIATYRMQSGPLGYTPLRTFVADKLKRYAGIETTAEDILLTSGSLQAIDLINKLLLRPGDTVIVEESNYGGTLSKLRALGVNMVPVPLDAEGMRMDALETTLDDLAAQGITPKYIFAIVTVHNPTGTILPLDRRHRLLELAKNHGVPVFEDECYSDLTWANTRPPALRALDDSGLVIHIGSFSKTVGPALRVGYINADWPVLGRLVALKTDAGSPVLEQMMLAEYGPAHFDAHVRHCNAVLESKLDAMIDAVNEHFGTTVEFTRPPGGIFLWLKLPEGVTTPRLAEVAGQQGVAVNPGPDWSLQYDADRWIRLCFANPPVETIRDGVAKLAAICHDEFGVPEISGNVRR